MVDGLIGTNGEIVLKHVATVRLQEIEPAQIPCLRRGVKIAQEMALKKDYATTHHAQVSIDYILLMYLFHNFYTGIMMKVNRFSYATISTQFLPFS